MADEKEKLDPCSSKFDPLVALYGEVKLPCPNAPIQDNVSRFEITDDGEIKIRPIRWKQQPKQSKPEKPSVVKEPEIEKEEKEEEEEVKTGGRRQKQRKNVLLFMEAVTGPLAQLRKCMQEKIKVKVVTRNYSGVRGHCTGYVAAFDKYWNLALTQVHEIWYRKKAKKVPAYGGGELVRRNRRPAVEVTVTPEGPKRERCERRLPALLMKGEHIVMVSFQN